MLKLNCNKYFCCVKFSYLVQTRNFFYIYGKYFNKGFRTFKVLIFKRGIDYYL